MCHYVSSFQASSSFFISGSSVRDKKLMILVVINYSIKINVVPIDISRDEVLLTMLIWYATIKHGFFPTLTTDENGLGHL